MISWPGRLPAGAVRGQVAHACDWLPTLTELCGVKLLNPDIDGKSITDVLRSADAPSPHDALHWQTGRGPGAQWAVRQGDWKLIGNALDTTDGRNQKRFPLFLANLAEDIGEKTNRAADQPAVVERLRGLHDDLVRRAGGSA